MAVDRPVEDIERLAEDALAYLLACPDTTRLLGQRREKVQFGAGQRHDGAATFDLTGVQVDRQIEERGGGPECNGRGCGTGGDGRGQRCQTADRRRRRPPEAPQDCPDAGDHFAGLERLGHVVIGAQFEPGDAVDDVVPGSQHHDADIRAFAAQRPQNVEAGAQRQHHVEHQQVQACGPRQVERDLSVGRLEHLVALTFEVGANDFADVRLVVGDENPGSHAGTIAQPGEGWRSGMRFDCRWNGPGVYPAGPATVQYSSRMTADSGRPNLRSLVVAISIISGLPQT